MDYSRRKDWKGKSKLFTDTPQCVNCILGGSEWKHSRVEGREGRDRRRGK